MKLENREHDDFIYDGLVDMTCWIRHLQGWEAGRQALRQFGIQPEKAICTYLGPGGSYATCELLLPDGRFLSVDINRDPVTGSTFVPPEFVEPVGGQQPEKLLALAIMQRGVPAFDACVHELYERKYKPMEPFLPSYLS